MATNIVRENRVKRWYEIAKDPNDPAIRNQRRAVLSAARTGKLLDNRNDYLCRLAQGKDVLDVGVVSACLEVAQGEGWLHGRLSKVAKSCLGVDILANEVEALKARGYDVICTDITDKPLERQFDLVVCGEVVEHVDAPGKLLKAAAQMMKPDGKAVFTTPNPWYGGTIFRHLFNFSPFVGNADHVA